tara:strand:- start:1435 stop:2337 length:903 start_codon:yes stop_codon:yes gene_type:complete
MCLTVIILTYNESCHIERAIASARAVADRIVVIDSGSDDDTVSLAISSGAKVLYNPWKNHATQFNWALSTLPSDTVWVLRLDADEIISEKLVQQIQDTLPELSTNIEGIYLSRRMTFLGKKIRWGGIFPVRILRLFRHGSGFCEQRWMDEHIVVSGPCADFSGEILDDNMRALGWWIHKHNKYASYEVIELLNLEYGFLTKELIAEQDIMRQAGFKRWIKEQVYARLPWGIRAFVYFFYRYILRLGFLDGREGAAFHVLQGFWYRYLVDVKLYEVHQYMKLHNVDAITAIWNVLEIDLEV